MMNYPSKQFGRSFASDELFCKNIFDVATIIETISMALLTLYFE